jgi:hypothetical protein
MNEIGGEKDRIFGFKFFNNCVLRGKRNDTF